MPSLACSSASAFSPRHLCASARSSDSRTVVVLPPHVPHSWRNISDVPGRIFASVTPGGFERLFIEIEASGAHTPEEIAAIEASLGIINEETEKLAAKA